MKPDDVCLSLRNTILPTWNAAGTSALFIILKLLAANLPDSTTPISRKSQSSETSGPVEDKMDSNILLT